MDIEFTWDHTKAKRNLEKHGVTFKKAKQVFFDPYLIVVEDCEGDGEMRYHDSAMPAPIFYWWCT